MEGPIEAIDASGSEERKLPANVEEASGEGSRGREAAGNSPAQSASGSAPPIDDYVSTCKESIKHGVAYNFYLFMLVVG